MTKKDKKLKILKRTIFWFNEFKESFFWVFDEISRNKKTVFCNKKISQKIKNKELESILSSFVFFAKNEKSPSEFEILEDGNFKILFDDKLLKLHFVFSLKDKKIFMENIFWGFEKIEKVEKILLFDGKKVLRKKAEELFLEITNLLNLSFILIFES